MNFFLNVKITCCDVIASVDSTDSFKRIKQHFQMDEMISF